MATPEAQAQEISDFINGLSLSLPIASQKAFWQTKLFTDVKDNEVFSVVWPAELDLANKTRKGVDLDRKFSITAMIKIPYNDGELSDASMYAFVNVVEELSIKLFKFDCVTSFEETEYFDPSTLDELQIMATIFTITLTNKGV